MASVTGPTILKTMLIFCLHTALQSVRAGHHTMDVVFSKIAWSFEALQEGLWPVKDWLGNIIQGGKRVFLADGYFCEVWCLIGDLDYWRDKLKQVNCNSLVPCCLCPCNSSSMPWHHFSFGAQWLQHIYTTTAWKASGASACLLFLITGVDNQSLHPDWMHAKHLGSDKVLGGSVLYLLIYFMLPGTVAENLIRVWNAIQEVYHLDNVKNRFGSLTTNMFAGTRGLRFRV